MTFIQSNSTSIQEVAAFVAQLTARGPRLLVAVAGPPASGKSLLAQALGEAVTREGRLTRIIPMDGFHLDNTVLDARGLRGRKGAPETFDAAGFIALMRRMKEGGEVVYPLFDRSRDLAVAGAGVIDSARDIAIVEGNYLLFDEDPWRQLQPLWDLTIWLDEPEAVLLDRLVQRWVDHDHAPEAARLRAESNDIPNCRRIIRSRLPADFTFSGGIWRN